MSRVNAEIQKETKSATINPRERRNRAKKQRFLKELAQTSNVQASARKAKILPSTVYDWRKRDTEFRDDWNVALEAGYDMLEMTMLERFRNGTERKIYQRGEHIATEQEFDNALAIRLLSVHRQAVAIARAATANRVEHEEHGSDRLDRKLDEMRERLLARRNAGLLTHQPASAIENSPAEGVRRLHE